MATSDFEDVLVLRTAQDGIPRGSGMDKARVRECIICAGWNMGRGNTGGKEVSSGVRWQPACQALKEALV